YGFMMFFFSSRRRHTSSDRDWSSDVCSSDLFVPVRPSSSRSTHRSGTSLPASTVWLAPLIVKVTIIQPPGPLLPGPRQSHELPRSEERRVGKECTYRWAPSA